MPEDKNIWEEFKKNEGHALSYIYHQNIDFLFSYGKKFTKEEDFILDTIQDLFYDLIRTRRNLGETDNIRFYLARSFKRKLLQGISKMKKQSMVDEEYRECPIITFSIEEELILNEVLTEKEELIRQGMNELNIKQREILYYKFTCDFNYDQICEVMSISYDSARQLVSRAITILKKYLVQNDFVLILMFSRLSFRAK